MTSAHFFYIPVVILVGLVLGFLLGRRAGLGYAREEIARNERKAARRAARAAARSSEGQSLAEEEQADSTDGA